MLSPSLSDPSTVFSCCVISGHSTCRSKTGAVLTRNTTTAISTHSAIQKPVCTPGARCTHEWQYQRWALKHYLCTSCDRFDRCPSFLPNHMFRFWRLIKTRGYGWGSKQPTACENICFPRVKRNIRHAKHAQQENGRGSNSSIDNRESNLSWSNTRKEISFMRKPSWQYR